MDETFDVDAFITRIGTRLVEQFDDARHATSPSTVGAAMEQPVRQQLEQILPRGIGVGSGFIIDSSKGTSRQMDVVLYEKDICPVFSINGTPETTYYPCEGVIAAGEIKSSIGTNELKDCFRKIASVKRLRRHFVRFPIPNPDTGELYVLDRGYGTLRDDSLRDLAKGQDRIESTEIFGFVVAGDIRMALETLCKSFLALSQEVGDPLSPNQLVVLSGGLVSWGKLRKGAPQIVRREQDGKYVLQESVGTEIEREDTLSARGADFVRYTSEPEAFRTLIRWIHQVYRTGRTSDVRAFDQYLLRDDAADSLADGIYLKEGVSLESVLRRKGFDTLMKPYGEGDARLGRQ